MKIAEVIISYTLIMVDVHIDQSAVQEENFRREQGNFFLLEVHTIIENIKISRLPKKY